MTARTRFIGGNWKMNTDQADSVALARAVVGGCRPMTQAIDVAIFPPFPYLIPVGAQVRGSSILLGAQDVYDQPDGAFTGEVSAAMLVDCACDVVLAGHSERRHVLGESDELVNRKTRAALDAGLWVVLCIGETLEERERGETDSVNLRQLRAGLDNVPIEQAARQVVIAYEPVWAIGTGRTASPEDAQAAHSIIRRELASRYDMEMAGAMRIIYGGSVKPGNAEELIVQKDVDGFLVGGASLVAGDFTSIAQSCLAPSPSERGPG